MQKPTKRKYKGCTIVIIVLLVLIPTTIWFYIQLFNKAYTEGAYRVSKSIEQSIEDGFYLGSYCPMEDSIYLDSLVINTKIIWYEKQWRLDHHWLSETDKVVVDGVNLVSSYEEEIELEYYWNNERERFFSSQKFAFRPISEVADSFYVYFSILFNDNARDTILYIRQ